jgi:hypothetical protein
MKEITDDSEERDKQQSSKSDLEMEWEESGKAHFKGWRF